MADEPHAHEIRGRAWVISTEVPEGVVPPSTSMATPAPADPTPRPGGSHPYVHLTYGQWQPSGHQCGDILPGGCDEPVDERKITAQVNVPGEERLIGWELRDCPRCTPRPAVPDDLLLTALSAWTGKTLCSLYDLIEVDTDTHDAMDRTLRAVIPEIQRQVRAAVAASFRDAARAIEDGRVKVDDPLAKAISKACVRGPESGMVCDDPRDIAFVAYRHLAKRLLATEEGR